MSFTAGQLPARLLVVSAGGKVLETHDIGEQTERCGGDDSRLLFAWL